MKQLPQTTNCTEIGRAEYELLSPPDAHRFNSIILEVCKAYFKDPVHIAEFEQFKKQNQIKGAKL